MFGVDPNNIDAIRAAIKAGSEGQVEALNTDLIRRYKAAMADYNANVDSGQMSPVEGGVNYRPAPKVPMGYELAPPNEDGYVFYQPSQTPVCDAVPVNPDKTQTQAQINSAKPQGIVDVGQPIPTNPGWFTLGPHDTAPGGKSITMPDGHTYVKYTGFAPGTGWYLQVS